MLGAKITSIFQENKLLISRSENMHNIIFIDDMNANKVKVKWEIMS